MLKGNYLGAVLAGQVKVEGSHNEQVELFTPKTSGWENNIELMEAYDEIPEVTFEKITSTAYTLQEISKYIVEKEYLNIIKEQLNNRHIIEVEDDVRNATARKNRENKL